MSSRPSDRPNVILFFTDQQRWDTLGAAGNPLGLTPNLDRMCARGTSFDVACTPNPVCAPTRASLQTGRYPSTVGVHRNGLALDASVPRLGEYFQGAGYRTGYIGTWHLSEHEPVPAGERRGWDRWLASNIIEFTSEAYRTVVYDEDDQPVFLPGYRSDALTDAAIRFVTDHADDPFMIMLSLPEPHHQNELDNFPAPDGYRDLYRGAWLPPDLAALPGNQHQQLDGYYGQIRRLDDCVGRLTDALRSLEIDDDTVIIYTSDHGCHFKTRNSEYKRSPHDASVRVPLIIDGPGYRNGGRIRRPVSTIDVLPTLLDAAGIDMPEDVHGAPLRTRADPAPDDARAFIQISESETGRAIRTRRWKYHVNTGRREDVAASDLYREAGLYDLEADPYELDNLIGVPNFAEVTEQLRAALIADIARYEGIEATVEPHPPTRDRLRYPEPTIRRHPITARRGEW